MESRIFIFLSVVVLLTGCSCLCGEPHVQPPVIEKQIVRENNLRGTVTEEWHETMHDTIKVPGQIDPTNTYYRAPHKTVVEIRPDKYSETRFDQEGK